MCSSRSRVEEIALSGREAGCEAWKQKAIVQEERWVSTQPNHGGTRSTAFSAKRTRSLANYPRMEGCSRPRNHPLKYRGLVRRSALATVRDRRRGRGRWIECR